MHIDKLLPQAEIRCFQPYQGLLTVSLKENCEVKIRIPDFTCKEEIKVTANGKPVEFTASGNFLKIAGRKAGEKIEMTYPVPTKTEEIVIGNKKSAEKVKVWYPLMEDGSTKEKAGKDGFNQYRYRVTWKGDTVVKMEPAGKMPKKGYSDFEKREVELFYGEEGPGRLYQREYMTGKTAPKLAPLHMDTSPIDYWWLK